MRSSQRPESLLATALVAAFVGGGSAATVLALARPDFEPTPEEALRELRVRRLEALAASGAERLEADLAEFELAALEALAHDGPVEGTPDEQARGERIRAAVDALRSEERSASATLEAALDEARRDARLERLAELAGLDL